MEHASSLQQDHSCIQEYIYLSATVRSAAKYSVWPALCSFCKLVMGPRRPCTPMSS